MQRLLEVCEPRVGAAEDGDVLVRQAERADPLHDELGLVVARHQHRLRPVRPRRAQRLLGTAEVRHEPVGEREHLRRRAVVLLEPDHRRLREPRRHTEQVLGRCAGERVDRLIVVPDDAELVTVAEPELEQRLLQHVHVLVLVDRERAEALAEQAARDLVGRVELDRKLEQILEVGVSGRRLPLLVLRVHAAHQIGRNRRLVLAEVRAVALPA